MTPCPVPTPTALPQGLIRVLENKDAPPPFNLEELLAPKPYEVRVYALDGFSMQPMDDNGKSDPFLKVREDGLAGRG